MYTPQNAKTVEAQGNLPVDTIFDAVVINIKDGTVGTFVKDMSKWNSKPDQECIEVSAEFEVNGKKLAVQKLLTYNVEKETGHMLVTAKSNMDKWRAKYGSYPSVGQKVKIITDSKGFGKIKLD